MPLIQFNVSGMSCQHCAQSVQNAVEKNSGVATCQINLAKGIVTVTLSSDVNQKALKKQIENAIIASGYQLLAT
ncbi:MAG: heavy-metal-associated domain-containing protein [Magnetococcales bacterium]|nr:heavy-metal-associated domain-containing protein [Magnetococcales bacterium]